MPQFSVEKFPDGENPPNGGFLFSFFYWIFKKFRANIASIDKIRRNYRCLDELKHFDWG